MKKKIVLDDEIEKIFTKVYNASKPLSMPLRWFGLNGKRNKKRELNKENKKG